MILPFSKSYLSTYQSEDDVLYKRLRLYYVYKDKKLLGQYFRQNERQFFTITDRHFKIESTEKWHKNANNKIRDQNSNTIVGEYPLIGAYNETYYHFPDVPYTNPYLKLIVAEEEFEFRRQKPEIEYNYLDTANWGHYSFELYNKQNLCVVRYDLKIEKPILDGSIVFNNNLEGTIETKQANLLLVFAGFFLLERFFDDQNKNG